jgi:predicted nucleic acid-binding protein
MAASAQPMLRVLLDTNVVLDWLLDRKPWSDEAQPMWDLRDAERLIGFMPASALTDVFYIARRQVGISGAEDAVDRCLAAFQILAVDKTLLQQARALPSSDFEDNVQIACAQSAGLDLIVTRDPTGFRHSSIPAVVPPDVLTHVTT